MLSEFFQEQLSFLPLIRKTADGVTSSTIIVLFKVIALHTARREARSQWRAFKVCAAQICF